MSSPPLCTWTEGVRDDWIDYNGHLSEAYYVLVLGHATDGVMDAVGLGPSYRSSAAASLFTVEAHIRYLDQVSAGERSRGALLGDRRQQQAALDWHELYASGTLRATEEILGLHVAGDPPVATPFPDEVATGPPLSHLSPEHASRSIRVG